MGEEGGVHCTFFFFWILFGFPSYDLGRSFFLCLLLHGPLFPALELDHGT